MIIIYFWYFNYSNFVIMRTLCAQLNYFPMLLIFIDVKILATDLYSSLLQICSVSLVVLLQFGYRLGWHLSLYRMSSTCTHGLPEHCTPFTNGTYLDTFSNEGLQTYLAFTGVKKEILLGLKRVPHARLSYTTCISISMAAGSLLRPLRFSSRCRSRNRSWSAVRVTSWT